MKVKSPEMKPVKSDPIRKVSPRNRIKYSAQQLHRLEKVFLSTQYPDSSILEDLSNTLDIDVERLSIWFQNRRSKFKRQAKGSHVNWMRQQMYPQGASQTHGPRDQSEKGKCHVLSPPVPSNSKKDDAIDKPRSNLHYLPSSSSLSGPRGPECDPAYSQMTSPMFPSTHNVYSALSDAMTGSDPLQSTLQLSHLVNELSQQQYSPSSYTAQSGYTSPPAMTPTGSYPYPTYPPYYGYQNAQLSFPQHAHY